MKENKLSRPLPVTAWLHKSPQSLLGKLVFLCCSWEQRLHVPCRSLMPNSDLITIWLPSESHVVCHDCFIHDIIWLFRLMYYCKTSDTDMGRSYCVNLACRRLHTYFDVDSTSDIGGLSCNVVTFVSISIPIALCTKHNEMWPSQNLLVYWPVFALTSWFPFLFTAPTWSSPETVQSYLKFNFWYDTPTNLKSLKNGNNISS